MFRITPVHRFQDASKEFLFRNQRSLQKFLSSKSPFLWCPADVCTLQLREHKINCSARFNVEQINVPKMQKVWKNGGNVGKV